MLIVNHFVFLKEKGVQKMKKVLSFLAIAIVLIALVVCFSLPAKAYTEGIYTYTVSNNEATITKVNLYANSYTTIPSTLGGYPVTGIGEKAFYKCTALTGVTIPDGVLTIGTSAFEGCNKLISVSIGKGVTAIGERAFWVCSKLNSITIPDSVTSIGDSAFYGCDALASVTLGNSVTTIGNSAFSGCDGLTSITIPDSVTSIGDRAFYYCMGLTNASIGKGVANFGDDVFYYCTGLKTVTISDGVKSIGKKAFYKCTGLTSINIPDSVTSIGEWAFYTCTSLSSITIPHGVPSIDARTFSDCTSLISVTIPYSVTSIGVSAFLGCDNLEKVYYNGTEEEWEKITISEDGNQPLLNADIVFAQSNPIEDAIAGTVLTTGVVGEETVIIVPTSNNVAMTESELAAILNDASITITSNNGIIGTGCKVTIGEYEVDLVVKGDIDGDGVATVFDALMVKKALANNGFENEALREFAADVDGADRTTEADVDAILSYIVGKGFINNSESIELAACYSGNSISDTSLSVITLTYLNENKYDVAIRSYTSQFTEGAREPIVVNGITYSYLGGGGTPDAEYTINNDNTITFTISGFFYCYI